MLAAPPEMPRFARHQLPLLIALLTLITNFAYLHYSNGDFFFPDSFTYLAPARGLLHGHGYVNAEGAAETMRTPVYPLFLLPFVAAGENMTAVVAAQHLMNVGLALAIYWFTRRRLGPFTAIAAAVIFALDTPTIHYANKVLTETLFAAGLFALFVLALPRRSVGAGLLAGVLVLVRPVAILYFAVLAAYSFRLHRKRATASFLLAALILPLGWAARNAWRTGVFTVSSVAGVNMLSYRAAGALAMEDGGDDFAADLADHQKELSDDAEDEIDDRLHVPAEDLPQSIVAREYGRIGRRIALQHPAGLAMLTARGVLVGLFQSDAEAMAMVSRFHPSILQLLIDAWTVAVAVFAAIGVAALWHRDRALAALLALTIGYFLFISAGGEAEARFRVPVVPQLAIAAGAGLEAVRKAMSQVLGLGS